MSRYAEAHANIVGPGDARPTALDIIKDEDVAGKLKGKIIVITGTSSGIGIETARALATTGATLYLTARDLDKAKAALADFFDPSSMKLIEMDQNSLESVRKGAAAILATTDRVNILINNAGIMALPNLEFTQDGHEKQFGVNHVSHFLFFQLLKPALLAASTPEFQSRVVAVSSAGHQAASINSSDNYNFQKGGYSNFGSYAQSKTANIYMANEIERRYGSRGLHATSLHPGGIMTNLGQHLTPDDIANMTKRLPDLARILKSPAQGAATTVYAAISKDWEGRGGRYLADCAEAPPAGANGEGSLTSCTSHTYDAEREARLWTDSLKLVGLEDEQ